MLDIAWEELALIVAVAVVVIGPKELPTVLRTVGRWVRKVRSLTGEFQKTLDEAVREAELDETREQVRKISQADLRSVLKEQVDPDNELKQALQPPSFHMDSLHGPSVDNPAVEDKIDNPVVGDKIDDPVVEEKKDEGGIGP